MTKDILEKAGIRDMIKEYKETIIDGLLIFQKAM